MSSVTQQGTTIQAMPGLPGGTTFFRQSGSNEGPRMMRQESRSAAISPVNRAIEEKSPEGVESDFTFRKDMDDRLERLDRQVGEIRMEAQDFSPDRKISLERKIDELRRDKNEVRAQLQDVVAPGAPKGHERSRAEESMDRLEQRYRDVYSDLRRSSPAGEKGNEAQRDAFLRDVGAKLGDLQKRIDGLSRSLQGTAGEQKRKLQQAVDELEKQRTGLQQKLDRLTAVGRGRWDRVKQEIDQGIDAMERTLRSTEEQQKSAGDGEGGQEEPPRRR